MNHILFFLTLIFPLLFFIICILNIKSKYEYFMFKNKIIKEAERRFDMCPYDLRKEINIQKEIVSLIIYSLSLLLIVCLVIMYLIIVYKYMD